MIDVDNDGHGSCVGCTFNHNSTNSIKISGVNHGQTFVGCNIFYGDIEITNSYGIVFADCIILGHKSSSDHTDITFTSCTGANVVDHCIFLYVPTITGTSSPQSTVTNSTTMSTGTDVTFQEYQILTKTYTTNSYVTSDNWIDSYYKYGPMFYARINLRVTSSPGTTFREIGRITLPRNLNSSPLVTLAPQTNSASTLTLQISTTGVVSIYSTGTADGFYRGSIVVPFVSNWSS